jgi:hypothetical protein
MLNLGGFTRATIRVLGQMCCRHHMLYHVERRRLLLVCAHCGYESPGWDLGPARPISRYSGDVGRHVLNRSQARPSAV